MQSRATRVPDLEATITLRDPLDAIPRTASGIDTPIQVERSGAVWGDQTLLMPADAIVSVNVIAVHVDGAIAYRIKLLAADNSSMTSAWPVAAIPVTGRGEYQLTVDSDALNARFPTGEVFLATAVEISGDAEPKINFGAWLAPGRRG